MKIFVLKNILIIIYKDRKFIIKIKSCTLFMTLYIFYLYYINKGK